MKFLLQKDEVSLVEKRVVRAASMLLDAKLYSASLSDIKTSGVEHIPLDAVPVGTVEFVSAVMKASNISQPAHMTYPECLRESLQRNIWEGYFGDHTGDIFVKPRHNIKGFTGALKSTLSDDSVLSLDYPVWYSEPVQFTSEWRYYISGGKMLGAGRYDDGDDNLPEPDIQLVKYCVQQMMFAHGPLAYALDFGVLADGRTALVEANDGWAIGYYKGSCSYQDYARLLHARWVQLAGSHTKLTFPMSEQDLAQMNKLG